MSLREPIPVLLLLVAVLLAPPGLAQDSGEGPPPPWEVSTRQEGEPPWGPLFRLRALADDYQGSPYWGAYAQMLGTAEMFLGNHAAALRAFDLPYPPRDSVGAFPGDVRARDAVAYLADMADTTRVLMINERHHAASDRILTLELLPVLRGKGFTHLAAEALAHDDEELNSRDYPVEGTGYYTAEPVFGELLREARRLGYTIVPYESTGVPAGDDTLLTSQEFRDLSQARNLAAILEDDPDARILVHAGYSHVLEEATERWSPMALYFRELTGIDPVTVDQTRLSERGDASHEHPQLRAAIRAGLLTDRPVVLENPDGTLRAPVSQAVDVQVLGPRTAYRDGRPGWMALRGRRIPTWIDVPEAERGWCHVEARVPGEPADAIPLDTCEVAGSPDVALYLPPGMAVEIRVHDEEGRLLRSFPVQAPRSR
jgi:hypothetical protein